MYFPSIKIVCFVFALLALSSEAQTPGSKQSKALKSKSRKAEKQMSKVVLSVTPEWTPPANKGEEKLWLHWDFKNVGTEDAQINLYEFDWTWKFQASPGFTPSPKLVETQEVVREYLNVPPSKGDFPIIKPGDTFRRSVWLWAVMNGKPHLSLPALEPSLSLETVKHYVFTKPGRYQGDFCFELLPSKSHKVTFTGLLCAKGVDIDLSLFGK